MKQKFSLVSNEVLDEIKNTQLKILSFFEAFRKDELADYITEAQAMGIVIAVNRKLISSIHVFTL
jgi:hypothetical protein